tara:strand:- start:2286 stop:5123 length:2838 start_codon:yes stop_codon:yes gene_type:complete
MFQVNRTNHKMTIVGCALATTFTVSQSFAEDGAETGALEEVIVTGSRIARSGFDSPIPTVTITADSIEKSGSNNIGEILLELPSIGGGVSAGNGNLSLDAGSNFINLRTLGVDRTLVLINGRRRVAGSNLSSAVDLTTIPHGLIERVEVVTGGASAVYGADAVTGVVNVVLKKDFEGIELSAQGGLSQHGGAGTYDVGVVGGFRFNDDRGSFTFATSYSKAEPLEWNERREYGPGLLLLQANPNNTGPNDGIPDQLHYDNLRLNHIAYGSSFVLNNTYYTFDEGGAVRPMQHDSEPFGPTSVFAQGGDGWVWDDFDQLRVGFERVSTNAYVNYDLTDSVNWYLESEFTNSSTRNDVQPTFDLDLVLQRDNAFMSQSLANLMDTNGLTSLILTRGNKDHGLYSEDINRNTYTIVTGIMGEFSNGWNYNVSYQYGQYDRDQVKANGRIEARFRETVDAITDPVTGEPICRDPAAVANGCVPLNILGPNAANPESIAYFRHDRAQQFTNTQRSVVAQVSGDLFELPAGEVLFSAGAEYRKDTTDFQNDGLSLTNQLWFLDNSGTANLKAEVDVTEVYGELVVPILADKSLFQALNLEAAVRLSDYSTIGNTTAWRFGLDWALTDELRLRSTISRSVRAPNLNELFSTRVRSGASNDDPCDVTRINLLPNRVTNCAALGVPVGHIDDQQVGQDVFTGGNALLNEEESDSYSFGFVVAPNFMPGLNVSLDYWNINIAGAINALDSQTVLDRCVDLGSVNNIFCPFVQRRADYQITAVFTEKINVSSIDSDGLDIEASYDWDVGFLPGDLRLSLGGTFVFSNETLVDSTNPDSLIIFNGEVTNPEWAGTLKTSYVHGPFNVDLLFRMLGSAKADVQIPSAEFRDRNEVSARTYVNVVTGYEFNDRYRVNFGINNLLDKAPPRLTETYRNGTEGLLYDHVGRFFFLGATAKF